MRFAKPHQKQGNNVMIRNDNLSPIARLALAPLRLALLASVAGLGFAVVMGATIPNSQSTSPALISAARGYGHAST
jgi:hypothetical protein